MDNMKKSFTLAEILFTMAIIGLIAIIVLPRLHFNTSKTESEAKLKKFYLMMNDAIERAEADYQTTSDKFTKYNNSEFFDNYIKNYIKYEELAYSGNEVTVKLPDGIVFTMGGYSSSRTDDGVERTCYPISIDINGDNSPNKSGKDQFVYHLCTGPDRGGYD